MEGHVPARALRAALLVLLAGTPGCPGSAEGPFPGSGSGRHDGSVDGARPVRPDLRPGAADGRRLDGGVHKPDMVPSPDRGKDQMAPRPYPDVSAANVNCSTWVVGDKAKAKQIYDAYFGSLRPKTAADFKWKVDASLLTPSVVKQVAFASPTTGQSDSAYHDLFDFKPTRFQRTTSKSNLSIFATLNPQTNPDAPYKQFNPTDYVPATMTHYARGTTSDVIATQFVLRVACMKPQMQKALFKCPDCADAVVMLSKNDSYKVFELRLVRVNQGQLEVSRPFKMVSVDCSGNMVQHSQVSPYLFGVVGGETLRAKWRGEISGYLAQTLGTYMKPTAVLVRLSSVSPSY